MQARLIDISTVNAQIGISSTNPKIIINKIGNRNIEIDNQKGDLEMSSKQVKLQIDNTESLAALNIKSTGRFISENAQAGMQSVLETIGRYAQQGDMLMDISKGSNALYQVAVQNENLKSPPADVMPLTLPTISWQQNSLNINYTPDKVSINPDNLQQVDVSFERGNINIKLVQAAKVYIKYIGEPNYAFKSQEIDTQA
jgi:pullulanase/glycogen debranching enzyme